MSAASSDPLLAPDLTPRQSSDGFKWNGEDRHWVTTFHPIGWNGLGERVGYERWSWNGSAEVIRENYVAEPHRAATRYAEKVGAR